MPYGAVQRYRTVTRSRQCYRAHVTCGNARDVVEVIKARIAEIYAENVLSGGLRFVPFYSRIELISTTLNTVYKPLTEGVVLVIIILFLFLGNKRHAQIVVGTLRAG